MSNAEAQHLADMHGEKYLNAKVTQYDDAMFDARQKGDVRGERSARNRLRIYELAAEIRSAREAARRRNAAETDQKGT